MASSGSDAAFAYHEPTIATLLNQAGFLVVLNLINACLDKLLYCGLIGQLFIGILWGTPGAKWLDTETERVIQQLGYIGLIMLVYEGIGVPMGLSFILMKLVSASPLQAFAAGAALSATSLGTTFTILSTTNLVSTRLGTVTTGAAMLDDVVGLVMVQIISNLGGSASSFNAITVVRPLFVSIGFALGVFILCAFCFKPILRKTLTMRRDLPLFMSTVQFAFLAQTSVLVGLVAGATYAGTSSLFAAYLAGVIVSWFDGLAADIRVPNADKARNIPQSEPGVLIEQSSEQSTPQDRPDNATPSTTQTPPCSPHDEIPTGIAVYEKYYKEPVNRILIPLFFASIGFAIPITKMFRGDVIWRGIIYAILMMLGKMVTGLWLVRFSLPSATTLISIFGKPFSFVLFSCTSSRKSEGKKKKKTTEKNIRPQSQSGVRTAQSDQAVDASNSDDSRGNPSDSNRNEPVSGTEPQNTSSRSSTMSLPPKPKSLYPPFILGLAMVARGEVGYLIASLAESQGMFSSGSSGEISDIYLVVIWAISICTLVGPISVGTLVKRVKKLQQSRESLGADPLGVWGI
ncbi:hypothetical protein AbraCBS73388_009559 [Aspergillus brasiliensis]|uniref:Cation/H+ exchanger transmembrane domain-containing protein n=1 Tax=Aspergillus brasiliensis TaxID=319629 RepID=A0A9W5YUE8_9EURO|nr:hypothetical protein AbraCBS73388_009559 [Aspergillus brasiliensis]